MKLPKISLDNYQFTIVVFALLLIFGVSSFLTMPRTENPTVYIPGASVVVVYPGASPSDMEELIGIPIEEAINELDDIIKINTKLQDGIASISVEFSYNTDANEKFNEVVQQVNSIKEDLPNEIVYLDYVQFSSTDVAMMQLALVGDSVDFDVLNSKAEKLKREIEKVEGVKNVEILACPEMEVVVSVDIEKMALMNIPLEQIVGAIKSNNANIPGGSIDLSGKNFNIKTSGSYTSLEEIENTVINSYNGKLVNLHDIATVNYGFEDENYNARFNGKKAVFLVIRQKDYLNVFKIRENIEPKIQKFQKNLNPKISVESVFDQASIVDDRISGFMMNLLQGIILVGLIILFALGFKSALMVIIAIPLSLLVGLGIVDVYGIGIQQITIASLVVSLGLLVDNSIVVVENINRFLNMGYIPRDAAIKGTTQIGWPIVSATVTTLFAFIPIAMMPDKAGDFILGLPVTIIATLTISLFVALTLTPMIAGKVYKGSSNKPERKEKRFEKVLNRFINGTYKRTLDFSLRNKFLVIACVVLLLALSGFVFVRSVGISFFPISETPQLLVRVNMPEGTSLKKTNKVVEYVESILDTTKNIRHYASNIGHGNPRIYYNVFSKNYAKNYGDIYVELYEYVPDEFDALVSELRKKFEIYPGATISVKVFEQGVPINAPIEIYLNGDDLDILQKIAAEFEKKLKDQKGVINIENELSVKRSDLFVDINKDKASMFGVPIHEIDKTIRVALSGANISEFRDANGKNYNIKLRLPINEKLELRDFDKIYLKSVTGRHIPLSQLASIKFKEAPSKITRYNLQRTAVITADIERGYNLDEIMEPVLARLEQYNFPAGYDYTIRGELEARSETFGGMGTAMIIAFIAIFAVLVLQFKSFIQPFIIFIAFPLAIIGSIFALYFTGYTFSFTAFVGLISLIGIVINNSIILVDYTNKLVAEGKDIVGAVKEAGRTRFTPIILTTLTTIGGLVPLTLTGSEMWSPLGWTIIGGLIISTVLTLLVIPVLFVLLTKKKA